MSRRLLGLALLMFAAVPAVALAQDAPGPSGSATPAPTTSTTVTPTASASAAPVRPATGYGFSDPKPARNAPPTGLTIRSGARPPVHHPVHSTFHGPIATMPGFEMLGEGGSRFFVELSQSVQVEERKARGVVTYVLKGTHVVIHNNQNALVTVHFNTPVSRARLVPAGNDLLFVIELRANVTPVWKLNPGKEGSSVLVIDFPKGSYLPAGTPET